MVSEAVKHLGHARREVDEAIRDLAGGRVDHGARSCARAVEELLDALHELAWAECDRAVYGEEEE